MINYVEFRSHLQCIFAWWISDVVANGKLGSRSYKRSSYQSLISEGVVDTSDEEPEGPQVLKPEL